MLFFLLPSKSGECYTNMFRHLIEVARDFGHSFQLTSIHLDFENAVFEVARVFWPTVIIKGCHFIYSMLPSVVTMMIPVSRPFTCIILSPLVGLNS
jgi:hypothetical protein